MSLKSCMAFKSATLAGITIDRLHTLCAVVEAGTIVSAAGPDPNRQSLFSRQLKDLEKAIGTPLFDRVGKTLQLNENGRRVVLAAHTFFGSLDDVMNTAAAMAETVTLGANEAVLRWLVMPRLGELMAAQDLQSELIPPLQHVFAVPRTFLRTKEAAEVFEGRPIPFAELGGDPFFAKTARTTATSLGLNLQPVILVQSFSLLMSAVESGTAAAFIPTVAARLLPEQHFAQVSAPSMKELQRSLSLAWHGKSAESRAPVRRAVPRLKRALT
jgi:DNA-binding transcriptional LysR family regulator